MGSLIEKSKRFISKVLKADIVRVFSLTSVATLVKMLTGFVSVKVVASIIGPAGVALVGQLNNFATMVMSFASGGINSGITKYVAEYKEDNSLIAQYLSTALRITGICSLICAVLLIVLHRYISELIMLSPDYGYVFVIFGLTVFMYALNNLLTSVVNGYKEFKKFVNIGIANSILGVAFTIVLVLCWQLEGALISAVTYQSIMLLVTVLMIRKLPWFRWSFFKERL
ncbi:MAG: oligosaccharide flippase family protein, partial [Muribaculaceae bacterium]|nr:oligosaccharide flippase family protein [Muribaculaceae bacterium]